MAPAAFIAVESNASALDGDATMEVSTPSVAEPGDILLAIVAWTNSNTIGLTTPADWELMGSASASNRKVALLRRIVADDESPSHTFELNGTPTTSEPYAVVLLYRRVDPTAAIVAAAATAVSASASYVAPSATLTAYSDLTLLVYYAFDDSTFTPAAGTVERIDVAGGTIGDSTLMVADYHKESTGATGTKTATLGMTADGVAASFAIAAVAPHRPDTLSMDPPGTIGLPSIGV